MMTDAATSGKASRSTDEFDVVFVGGGLANALIALRLAARRPEIRWLLVESQPELFGHPGEQTWSFHASDLDESTAWLESLASSSWPGYAVHFLDLSRRFHGSYLSIRARDLRVRMAPLLSERALFGVAATRITANTVELSNGRQLRARLVVDGRGLIGQPPYPCGYQKFVGLNLKLEKPHDLRVPMLMDATVAQKDGFRFIYVLPWSASHLLIEDTRYSDNPALNEQAADDEILRYAASKAWQVSSIESRERGVLPIPLSSRSAPSFEPGLLAAGMASGRFHPTTGYSVPDAARFAETVATSDRLDAALANRLNEEARAIWRRRSFLRRLNNMLFLAASPKERWRVLRKFYERDEALIARFYAATLTPCDHARLLTGTPPVPIPAAIRAFVRKLPATERSRLEAL